MPDPVLLTDDLLIPDVRRYLCDAEYHASVYIVAGLLTLGYHPKVRRLRAVTA